MKTYNLKDSKYFNLYGTRIYDEEGFNRLKHEDREIIHKINWHAAYLATNSAGINARFKTDSKKIKVKVELNDLANMNHMSALGQTGLDLYVYNEEYNEFVFHGSTVYDAKNKEFEYEFGEFKDSKMRRYILNLPLYIGVKFVEVSFDDEATIEPDIYENKNIIGIYGTSITQGGCVSRPGMLHTNLISRWLDMEILNYGFSGSAFLEKEMADAIGKLEKPEVFIIDAQANAGVDERMKNNLETFIDTYLTNNPNAKIILASRIRFAVDLYNEEKIELRDFYDKFIEEMANKYKNKGFKFYFLDGSKVFKNHFTEMTVDGIHPNDLGSMEMAKFYYEFIKNVLND